MAELEIVLKQITQEYIDRLERDTKLATQINQEFAEKCDPYVPYITGNLASDITINENGITYNADYAEKVYDSPNMHNLTYHPLASSRWDEVAFENHRDELEAKAKSLVEQRLEEMR